MFPVSVCQALELQVCATPFSMKTLLFPHLIFPVLTQYDPVLSKTHLCIQDIHIHKAISLLKNSVIHVLPYAVRQSP